jgi:hypothetical protein
MLKRNLARIFVVTMIVCVTCTDSFADIRVRFARGRTSATMAGSIRSGAAVCYVAGAKNGQTLNATVSSRNGRVNFRSTGDTSYSETFDFSGDHRFCLYNNGGLTTYTLTVSIQ